MPVTLERRKFEVFLHDTFAEPRATVEADEILSNNNVLTFVTYTERETDGRPKKSRVELVVPIPQVGFVKASDPIPS